MIMTIKRVADRLTRR